MPCIVALVALLFPRIMIIILWLFTNWFDGVFSNLLIPILGFIFLPIATLWFSVVVCSFNGEWNAITIAGMVVAVAMDLGASGSGWRNRRRR
jgi:hypothetical protein